MAWSARQSLPQRARNRHSKVKEEETNSSFLVDGSHTTSAPIGQHDDSFLHDEAQLEDRSLQASDAEQSAPRSAAEDGASYECEHFATILLAF